MLPASGAQASRFEDAEHLLDWQQAMGLGFRV